MEVSNYFKEYKDLGVYFAPDYEQENEVLARFKHIHPTLSEIHTQDLKNILQSSGSINDKYFVADLLYLYDTFSEDLLEPLINCAIADKDPSFNRIFLRPAIVAHGLDSVKKIILEKSKDNDPLIQEGIQKCQYWLHAKDWM